MILYFAWISFGRYTLIYQIWKTKLPDATRLFSLDPRRSSVGRVVRSRCCSMPWTSVVTTPSMRPQMQGWDKDGQRWTKLKWIVLYHAIPNYASPYHAIPGWEAHIFLGEWNGHIPTWWVISPGRIWSGWTCKPRGPRSNAPGFRYCSISKTAKPLYNYIIFTLYIRTYIHIYIYSYNITDGYKWLIQKQETQRGGFYWHPLEELHVNEPWKTRRNRTSTPRRSRWPWQILGLHPDSVSFLRSFSWFCRSQTEVPLNILKLIQ